MIENVRGFEVETKMKAGLPCVRVSNARSGELIVDTDSLSIIGLENLSVALKAAARMADAELALHWQRRHEKMRHETLNKVK